jgi:hypothetical protein
LEYWSPIKEVDIVNAYRNNAIKVKGKLEGRIEELEIKESLQAADPRIRNTKDHKKTVDQLVEARRAREQNERDAEELLEMVLDYAKNPAKFHNLWKDTLVHEFVAFQEKKDAVTGA